MIGLDTAQGLRLHVNGHERVVLASAHHTLLEVLRRELDLAGAREGCGVGMCGACTVLLDGEPVSSCLMLAPLAAGREITTIEGLGGADGSLDPVQQASSSRPRRCSPSGRPPPRPRSRSSCPATSAVAAATGRS